MPTVAAMSRNPMLSQSPLGAYTDAKYEADLATLQNDIAKRYATEIQKLGYTDEQGNVIPGSLEVEANRNMTEYQRQMGLAGEGVTQESQRQGTLFSGYRGTQQARAEFPWSNAMARTQTDLGLNLAGSRENIAGLMGEYSARMQGYLADAAARRAAAITQAGTGTGNANNPPGGGGPPGGGPGDTTTDTTDTTDTTTPQGEQPYQIPNELPRGSPGSGEGPGPVVDPTSPTPGLYPDNPYHVGGVLAAGEGGQDTTPGPVIANPNGTGAPGVPGPTLVAPPQYNVPPPGAYIPPNPTPNTTGASPYSAGGVLSPLQPGEDPNAVYDYVAPGAGPQLVTPPQYNIPPADAYIPPNPTPNTTGANPYSAGGVLSPLQPGDLMPDTVYPSVVGPSGPTGDTQSYNFLQGPPPVYTPPPPPPTPNTTGANPNYVGGVLAPDWGQYEPTPTPTPTPTPAPPPPSAMIQPTPNTTGASPYTVGGVLNPDFGSGYDSTVQAAQADPNTAAVVTMPIDHEDLAAAAAKTLKNRFSRTDTEAGLY
jgi:hypothetical protein